MVNSGGNGILWLVLIAATSMPYAHCQAETKVVCNSQSWLYGDQLMNWHQAVARCRQRMGYYLAAPTNSRELACVGQFPATSWQHRWVGISDQESEGYYKFVHNGYRAYPLPWGQGQPDNFDNSEDCVVLRGYERHYGDVPCNKLYGYICQSATVDGAWGSWQAWSQCSATCGSQRTRSRVRHCNNPSSTNGGRGCIGRNSQRQACERVACPVWSDWTSWSECKPICGCLQLARTRQCHSNIPGAKCAGPSEQRKRCLAATCTSQWCPAGWYTGCTKCYRTGLGPLQHYEGAKTECEQQSPGSRLLAILSEDEQIDVDSFLSNRHYWIWNDITDQQREGVWVHGQTPTNYTNWDRGEPNGKRSENCVAIHDQTNGVWNDMPCRYHSGLQVLCERAHNNDFGLSNWGVWSPCSVTCGQGTRSRRRSCTWIEGRCSGNVEDIQMCSLPNCPPVTCPVLEAPVHGHMTAAQGEENLFQIGVKKRFYCDSGYQLQDQAMVTRQCLANELGSQIGNWSGQSAVCSPISCGEPPAQANGSFLHNGTLFGDVQWVSCSEGYQLMGGNAPLTRRCAANTFWTPSILPQCQGITCPMPMTSAPLVVSTTTLNYDSTAIYSCNPGYRLPMTSSANRRCTANCMELQDGGVTYTSCGDGYWEGQEPECEAVVCPMIMAPSHGSIISVPSEEGVLTIGTVKNFSCLEGYMLDPLTSQSRKCLDSGSWSGTLVSCLPVSCGEPPAPGNTVALYDSTTFQSTLTMHCSEGYRMVGDSQWVEKRCMADKQWSPPGLPECQVIHCTPLTASSPLRVSQTGVTFGSSANFSCDVGYMLAQADTDRRWCEAACPFQEMEGVGIHDCDGGQWSGSEPSCILLQCSLLQSPDNGEMISEFNENGKFHYGIVKTFTCNRGYYLDSNSSSRRCGATGQWTGQEVICLSVPCGNPEEPQSSVSVKNGTVFQSQQFISCKIGYRMSNSEPWLIRTCGADKRWRPEGVPECQAVMCSTFAVQLPLQVHLSGIAYDSTAQYTCIEGYTLSQPGSFTRRCISKCLTKRQGGNQYLDCGQGHWSEQEPTCRPVPCDELAAPQNGFMNPKSGAKGAFHFGVVKSFTCQKGYNLRSDSSVIRQCLASGQWSGVRAECLPVPCGTPQRPNHGVSFTTGMVYTYRSQQFVSCAEGYRLSNSAPLLTRTCDWNGQWAPSALPDCEVITCPVLKATRPLQVKLINIVYSTMARYSCTPGYRLSPVNGAVRRCTADCPVRQIEQNGHEYHACGAGYWSGKSPVCQPVPCGKLSAPAHGSMSPDERQISSFHFGVVKTFSCNQGYYLQSNSSQSRTCQATGRWTGDDAECLPVSCGEPAKPDRMQSVVTGTVFRSQQAISCRKGFRMIGDQPLVVRTCSWDKQWTPSALPECQVITCPVLTAARPLLVQQADVVYSSTLTYSCTPGYRLLPVDGGVQKCVADCPVRMRGRFRFNDCSGGSWSGRAPICSPIPCGKLSAPGHGSMSPDERQNSSFHFGVVKTFSCNQGYYLQSISSQSRTCQATGQWTGGDAECLPVSCGEPAKPDGTQSVVTGTVFRSQQAISCREGFRMIGGQPLVVRTCSWDKLWTPSALPECQVITCPVLTAARPLLVQHTGVVYSSTVTYSCTPGYRLLPADGGARKCVADCPVKTRDRFQFNDCSAGRWSGRAPLCRPVPCLPLRSPLNGIMTSKAREEQLFHFGITKAFTCNPGYTLRSSSSSSRHCQANGVWSGALAECLPVDCGSPELMEHGWQIITKTTFPGVQVIGCKSPYYFPMEERFLSRSCTAEGIWSPAELPVCRGLVCREPSSTPNLITTKTKPKHDNDTIQTATHSCPAGFAISLSGHRSRFCRAQCLERFIRFSRHSVCEPDNTLWEGTPPTCSRIPCRAIRAPVNGVIKSTSLGDSVLSEERQVVDDSVFETTLTFGCNTGYKLLKSGSNQQRCDASGQWVGPAQVCVPAGVWSAWGNWGQCSVLCGCGRKLRQRQCTGETGGPREGVNCSGSSTEGVSCLTKPCKGQLCPAGWIAGCLKCYQVSYFPLHTYRQAQSHCERQTHGSRLLVVASQEDHTDFGAFVLWRHVHTWMDISEFTNSTGDNSSTSKFQNWQVEGRNGPPSSCAVIGNAGDRIWTQEPCGAQYQAVCERGLATAGGYGEWGEWGRCSVTCGEGVRTRRRQCNDPEPSFEGANCTGVGQESGPCPVDACPRANCGRPDLMSNGWQVLTGTLAGDSQTLGCQVPFVLTGVPGRHTIRRCTANGTWTPEGLPSCIVLDCGNPSSSPSLLTEYQTLDNTSSTLAEVVHSCPDGFTMSSHGDRRRTCKEFCPRRFVSGHFRQLCYGSDTRWSGTPPLCTPLNCERLTTPINGKMISNPGQEDLFHVGINKTFSCNAGYRLGSTASGPRACLANRTWSGQLAQCTRELACPRPICEFQVGLCSLDQNRPVEACSVEAKENSDLGIVARVKRDTQPSCTDNDDKYIVILRVREELYKNSERCGFLPGITGAGSAGRYDIAMELTFEEGCPCPVPESGVTYLITAKCDPSRGRIVSHPHSLFQRQTTRGRKNLLRRCQWA